MYYKHIKTGEIAEINHPVNHNVWEVYQGEDAYSVVFNKKLIAQFKSLYLGVVQAKLDELDYDSLATVKLWEGDATFGAEATKILDWYKAIIAYNYGLLADVQNGGVAIPTDEEYLGGIPAYV